MIEWRPVVGYEALYSVSNTGEVFSQPKLCAFGKNAVALAIRRRYRECGNASQVAREFGISATYCGNICARRMWKHVASE